MIISEAFSIYSITQTMGIILIKFHKIISDIKEEM
uniref:Uncharacterized protein n=1 Tax=Ascaris lumbricoides TaxID=6252 RepID=A0A0M3I9W0_ASCLU